MAITQNTSYSEDENCVIFFRTVKRALGISSTRSMVRLVSNVLRHVCRNLSTQQVSAFINRMPGIFQPILYMEVSMASQQAPIRHLDELVECIYEEDRLSVKPYFSTEVQVLNAVVVILRKLDKYLNIFSYNILKPKWIEGLRQIPLEDAA